jgi:hypothetical protein
MKRKGKKVMKHIFWAMFLVTVFLAGWHARGERSYRHGFETGYEAASNHISSRIRTGMKEMQSFYIADIGFRFSPRGYTIAGIRFLGDETAYTAQAGVKQ